MCIQTQSPLPPPPLPPPRAQQPTPKKNCTTKSSNAIKIKHEQEKRDVVDKIEHAQTKSVTGQEKTHELGKYTAARAARIVSHLFPYSAALLVYMFFVPLACAQAS